MVNRVHDGMKSSSTITPFISNDVSPFPFKKTPTQLTKKQNWWKQMKKIKFWLPNELDGKYSIARMEAFDAYQKNTSLVWVIFILFMTPLPLASLMILMNYLPLAKPEDGWKANGIVFFRAFLTCGVLVQSLQWQRQYYLHGIHTTTKWNFFILLLINFVVSCFYVGILIFCSAKIAFPLPFSLILPFLLIVPLFLIANKKFFQKEYKKRIRKGSHFDIKENFFRIQKYQNIVLFNFSLLFLYPIYLIGYRKITNTVHTLVLQFAYTMVLPLMKLGLLILSKHHFAHIEDLAAVSSVFSVEFFNALFISMCMGMNMNWSKSSTTTTTTSSNSSSSNSSSNSWVTSSVMMAIDCLQMVASLWILTKKAKTLLQYIREQDSLKEEEVLIEEEKEEEEEEEGKKKKEIIRSSTSTKSHASLRHGRRRNTIEECLEFARKYQEAIKRNERDLRIQSSHGLKFERSRQVTHAITMGKEYFNRAVVSLKHTTLRRIDQIDEILPIEINQSFRSNSLRGKLLTMTTASTSTSTTNLTTKTTPLDRMLKTTNHSEIRPPRPFLSKATNAVMPTKDIATTVDGDTMVAPTHQFPSMAKKITKKIRGGGAQFFALIKDVEKYNTKVKILRETLSILYGLEHVILVEYVEAFIPFFYAIYLVATFDGSNREFFAEFKGRGENYSVYIVARNAMLYGVLEWISLVVLVIYVKKRFRMNLLYHLSFVLETHLAGIQSIMAFFLMATLNFNLEHFGMDFEFSFAWLRRNSSQPNV